MNNINSRHLSFLVFLNAASLLQFFDTQINIVDVIFFMQMKESYQFRNFFIKVKNIAKCTSAAFKLQDIVFGKYDA